LILYFDFFGAAASLPRRKKDTVAMGWNLIINVHPEFVEDFVSLNLKTSVNIVVWQIISFVFQKT
jgi:hypothetical protein